MTANSGPTDASISVTSWRVDVLEVGLARHPGSWVGPEWAVDEWMWSPINVVLARSKAETVLIDAGAGILGSWWPHAGFACDLAGALARADADPADVDRIVLTHLDFDHVGGVLSGSWPERLEPAFPDVPVVLLEDAARAARSDDPDEPLNAGTRAIRALETAGLLVEVADGAVVSPELRLRSAPGHRPGHATVEIGKPGDSVVFLADVLHHPLHAAHPEWDSLGDEDVSLALSTRRLLLAELADSGIRVVAAHVAASTASTVQRDGQTWRFVQGVEDPAS